MINIVGYRLPTNPPDPSRHSSCGWIALQDGKEVGWCNMSFLPNNTIKFEDAFVHQDYRGQGIYRSLWETRWNYIASHCQGMRIIAYCKPVTVQFYQDKGFVEVEKITLVERSV